ncbi:PAS domain-containing protein [Methylobacterium sp. J-030]|uniref:PAS domain-containing protein n=1 Tax=Methylobacterium sp. J-030 TaxID=2836627 RepID=UPI001FB8F286|nr:PAS domain-containing protein [Methylobacterium sp. J-030]MCJ2072945.1 PAS domain-containing protein [Methylobacterium sp. J-030]
MSEGARAHPGRDELQTVLDDADAVGRWQIDVRRGVVIADPIVALLFGFTPEFGAAGIPFETFNGGTHPDDRAHVLEHILRCAAGGGWFIAEHRVCSADGRIRRILARGKFDPDETGVVVAGRGIVVDITQGDTCDDPLVASRISQATPPLDHVVDLVLASYRTLKDLAEPKALALTEALLMELGFSLARAQVRAQLAQLH